ncbi:hypothetical protein Q3G72_029274 [Acer saccharum]|nr:hypothetical protein Q3G72_029274 [Acer saccharum]
MSWVVQLLDCIQIYAIVSSGSDIPGLVRCAIRTVLDLIQVIADASLDKAFAFSLFSSLSIGNSSFAFPPSSVFGLVNSATKSAIACPLSEALDVYLMLNLLSLITHLVKLPDNSGFYRICLSGQSMYTSTVCAWKYGLSFLAAMTNARAIFSACEYLVSASSRALLV